MLRSSIAIVIGPTPPGTGVRKARDVGRAGVDVADEPASVRLMPTSTTAAPDLTMSGETIAGTPAATTRTSASSVCRARSSVREWQIVTVAFAWSSRCAIGLPTMSLRPTTTACAPSSRISVLGEQRHDPERRRRHERRPAEVELAGVERVEAVDVLDRVDRAAITRASSIWPGSGSCTRIAVDRVVGVQLVDEPSSSSSEMSRGQPLVDRLDPGLAGRLVLAAM